MATDPLRVCMDAKKELDRAERQLQGIGEFYEGVGKALRRSPPRLKLSNSGLATRIGLDAPAFDFKAWPDRETVKERLATFYEAENAYAQAWRNLERGERSQFPEPNP